MNDRERMFRYPRRRFIRGLLRRMIKTVFTTIAEMNVVGVENVPSEEPLLVVANHFSFIDPVAMIHATPRPLEFLGGFHMPNAPSFVTWLPKVYGYYPVYRGTGSRGALKAAAAILKQGGLLGIFPEAGSWAQVLRPARPGTAYLAAQTGVRILPMGFDGLTEVFPALSKQRRAEVLLRIGKPFGPFAVEGRGRERRRQLDEIGNQIMSRIAELLPPERRGFFSDDPAIREAARGTEIYPWDAEMEG
ncbi:MAG: 1-acyl-sn-glycerol-3-phosphate acyltransferase [Anaerolineales bacterium]|nr:1-acyl-sn-glycerol-3-phosphate acyltransferase [Anaerolineales bacterium]